MHVTSLSGILLCLLMLGPSWPVHAQVSDTQLDNWLERLSVKKDPYFKAYRSVVKEVEALDTTAYCEAMNQMIRKASEANMYCQIRVGYIFHLGYNTEAYPCAVADDSLPWGDPLHLAYQVDDQFLIATGHRLRSAADRLRNEYGLASMHIMLAIELQDALGSEYFYERALDRYLLGELQYHSRDYEGSIRSINESLRLNEGADPALHDTLNNYTLMFMYNTLGLAYDKLGQYEHAFAAYDKALAIAPYTQYHAHWIPLIQGNRGDIFFKLGQYDSAYALLEKDVKSSLQGGQAWAHNAAGSMQYLARIKAKRGQPREALADLHTANRVLRQHYNSRIQSLIYYGFMEVFEMLNRADSLKFYTDRYIAVHDSLEQQATEARAEIVQVRLDNQTSVERIKTLNKEKRRIALIRNFIILITLMLFGFGWLYHNSHRQKMKIRHQQANDARQKAEAEAAHARDELHTFTQHLLEKNTLVENLQQQLSHKELSEVQQQAIAELSHHTILTDNDWDQFRQLFEKVYPGFFHQLKSKAPDITTAEMRIAALVRLRLNSKDAAMMLGISPNSVYKARQRLKQRLDLQQDSELEDFFNSF